MDNNQITFTIQDNKITVTHATPVNIQDFLQVISTGILSAMQSIVAQAPKEQQQEIKEDLYDMYNAAASTTLSYFAPDIEMRPHLTSQAILEAENKIINDRFQKTANRQQRRDMARKEKQFQSIKGGK